jgi:cell division septation protein DedD
VATGAKKSGGDMVLGGRHLVGIFLVMVVLFGVIFTLGYLLGRSQYDSQLQAAASTLPGKPDTNVAKPAAASHSSAEAPPAEPPSDWDFYHSGEPEKPAAPLPVQPKSISSPAKAALKPTAKPAAKPNAKPNDNLEVPAAAKPIVPSAGKPAPAAKSLTSPLVPRGASVLQVAALVREADALALAQALQKKKFPAFVLDPPAGSNDHFFRVQVGPYADAPSASAARQKLESQGFKSIIKR